MPLKFRMDGMVASPTPTVPISSDSINVTETPACSIRRARIAADIHPAVPPPTMTTLLTGPARPASVALISGAVSCHAGLPEGADPGGVEKLAVGRQHTACEIGLPPDLRERLTGLVVEAQHSGPGPQISAVPHPIQHVLPARLGKDIHVQINVDTVGRPMAPLAQSLRQAVRDADRIHIITPELGIAALADAVMSLEEVERLLIAPPHDSVELPGRDFQVATPGKQVRQDDGRDLDKPDTGGFEWLEK